MGPPLIRTLENINSSQKVEVCGKETSLSDLASQYKVEEKTEHTGNKVSIGLFEFNAKITQEIQDEHLTYEDAVWFCKANAQAPISVGSYNQIVRRFEKPDSERLKNLLSSNGFGSLDIPQLQEHSNVIAVLNKLYFDDPKTAKQYFGMKDDSAKEDVQIAILSRFADFISRYPVSKSDAKLLLMIINDVLNGKPDSNKFEADITKYGTDIAVVMARNCAKDGFKMLSGLLYKRVTEQHLPLSREGWLFGQLIENAKTNGLADDLAIFAERLLEKLKTLDDKLALVKEMSRMPESKKLQKLKIRLLQDKDTAIRTSALETLDYNFIKNNPVLIAMFEKMAKDEKMAAAWLFKLNPAKYHDLMITTLKEMMISKSVAYPALFEVISNANISSLDKTELKNTLLEYLTILKAGRVDETMSKDEIDTARLVRYILVSKCGMNPFEASDPVEQLEKRMRENGTEFPEDDGGNYRYCSSTGYLGPDDSLIKTINDDLTYLKTLGISPKTIAHPMKLIRAHYKSTGEIKFNIVINGRNYHVEIKGPNWSTSCPFIDSHDTSENEYVVTNESGDKYYFVGLMPHLIETHGFFEGKGTDYRLEPNTIIKFFNLH